jgi:putative two-component system hydrogenase maturation factor HypX/HoxX
LPPADSCPTPVDDADPAIRGRARPPMRQADRAIDWQHDDTARILARLNAADGFPGVADELVRRALPLFDGWPEDTLRAGKPGDVIAWRETAILRATVDGAVWIGHLRRRDAVDSLKLPATQVLAEQLATIPEAPLDSYSRQPAEPGRTSATRKPGGSVSCTSTSTTAP